MTPCCRFSSGAVHPIEATWICRWHNSTHFTWSLHYTYFYISNISQEVEWRLCWQAFSPTSCNIYFINRHWNQNLRNVENSKFPYIYNLTSKVFWATDNTMNRLNLPTVLDKKFAYNLTQLVKYKFFSHCHWLLTCIVKSPN